MAPGIGISVSPVLGGGFSWARYWAAQSLQWIEGGVESDGYTLSDKSGNDNDAVLVNSNCLDIKDSGDVSVVSADPINDGFSCFDFSVDLYFTCDLTTGPRWVIGRANGAVFNSFLSAFVIYSDVLKYYTADGSSNTAINIGAITAEAEYHLKATVDNTNGTINWELNGVAGNDTFTNKTPATLQTGDEFLIGRGNATYYNLYGKLYNIKFYSSTNYANLSNNWPCSEGYETTVYDIEGSTNLTLDAASNWTTQNTFHWNYTQGFELYGNSDTSNHLIRVPYKSDGSKLTPTIAGYTKFSDCPAGNFHNFAETGIKRNPTGDAALTAVGIDSDDVVYYGDVDGLDNYSFCRDYLAEENNYVVAKASADKRGIMAYPQFAYYLQSGNSKRIVGTTGKIHSTSIKNCVGSGSYDTVLRNGTYSLTSASDMDIVFIAGGGLIGESKTGAVVNAKLSASTALATIENTSLFFTSVGPKTHLIANGTFTAQNMRYVVHGDHADSSTDSTRTYKNARFIHYGNHEAYLIDSGVFNTCDAFGGGFQSNVLTRATDSYFEGHVADGGQGRGFALHSNGAQAEVSNHSFTRCEFKSTGGTRSFRVSPGSSGQLDKVEFTDCDFNEQNIFVDPKSTYAELADKIQLFIEEGNTEPTIDTSNNGQYIGLQFEADVIGESISAVDGATTTLLMGNVISDTSDGNNHIRGDKNITDDVRITNHVHLGADMLQDCSVANKTMQIIVAGTTYTITFDADYTTLTNAEVVDAINTKLVSLSCDATCKLYDYVANADFRYL